MTINPISLGYVMLAFPVLTHRTVLNEIRVLREMGHPVRVFSILEPDVREDRLASAAQPVPVTYCWKTRIARAAVAKANLAVLARVGPSAYRRAFALAKRGGLLGDFQAFTRFAYWAHELTREGVTHLHAHFANEATAAALVFSWLTLLPFSFTAHAYDIFRSPQLLDLKLREASFVVTVSAYNRQYLAEHFGPEQVDKIHVICPLVDLSQFSIRPSPRHGPPTILAVGRLTEKKGFIYLVEACRILRERGLEIRCRIVGQGEDQPLLEDAIDRYDLGGRVELIGALPQEAIPPLLEDATLFALPCVIARNGDRDGMPLVLMEAMARGAPVVSSDIIGIPDLVRDGAGLLVPPGDPVALANAIQRLVQLPTEEREAMGRVGRGIVGEFDAVKGAARLLELVHNSQRKPNQG